jgi:hypothetical protein
MGCPYIVPLFPQLQSCTSSSLLKIENICNLTFYFEMCAQSIIPCLAVVGTAPLIAACLVSDYHLGTPYGDANSASRH